MLFKIVFGSAHSEPVFILLLNALLQLKGSDRIAELTFLNPALRKVFEDDKGAILDVRARDGNQRHYNVEVQLRCQSHYIQRALFYVARLYTDQLTRGKSYSALREC